MAILRPTFMGFETAKTGLTAAQKGLDIAGQNLTNWDSVGYTRQRVTQVATATDVYRNRYSTSTVGVAGQGVNIIGIDQTRDVYLDKRFREEMSDVGYHNQASTILNDIQSVLDELNTDTPDDEIGLRACLLNISDALQEFSINAYSETHANIVCTEFKSLCQTIQQISNKLTDSYEQQKYDLEVNVEEVNTKLQKIASLNQTIMESIVASSNSNYYFGPNELLDERNVLLDELSEYMDFHYSTAADGTVTIEVDGHPIVEGNKFDKMEMTQDENTGVVGIRWISTNEPINSTTGSLKASLDYINGRGPNLKNPGESVQRGYLYYQDKLDAFAQTIVNVVNNIIPEVDKDTGEIVADANGNTVFRTLLGAQSDVRDPDTGTYPVRTDIPVTAQNLSITDHWNNNSGYIIFQRNTEGVTENVGTNALALADAISSGAHYFNANGEEFDGTLLDYVKGYSTTLAEDISFSENREVACATIAETLNNGRDETAGVVVDEEVANLMLYQKSLSAASRLMTVMDEALDVLINRTGRVGL